MWSTRRHSKSSNYQARTSSHATKSTEGDRVSDVLLQRDNPSQASVNNLLTTAVQNVYKT